MPTFDKEILIKNIKQLMKENNVTQPQLAEELSVSQPSISKCLTGKQSISIELVYQIAHRFNVSIDELCNDHSTESAFTTEEPTSSHHEKQIQILIDVCTALATIFKTSTLRTNEFERKEEIFIEEYDNYGNPMGRYYQKRDQLNMDPVNKYTSIYFPNYDSIRHTFDSPSEANEYLCILEEEGNALATNISINEFLGQLTDLQKVYLKNSMSTESYHNAIDDNLATLIHIWDKK